MRLRITLMLQPKSKYLPIDYQYFISSWIYKRMADGDPAFAEFLHEEGYQSENKTFKLFNFSPLQLKPFRLDRGQAIFELLSETLSFEFRTALPDIATPLIKGLFQNASGTFGNEDHRVDFNVRQIEILPTPVFEETITYKLGSLCVVTRPPQDNEKYGKYLFPSDEGFTEQLTTNLLKKYVTVSRLKGPEPNQVPALSLTTDQEHKTKRIKVKPNTPQETDVRGSLFDCTVTATPEVHKVIWEVGLGEKNSMGCGWVEVQ